MLLPIPRVNGLCRFNTSFSVTGVVISSDSNQFLWVSVIVKPLQISAVLLSVVPETRHDFAECNGEAECVLSKLDNMLHGLSLYEHYHIHHHELMYNKKLIRI